MKLLFALVAVAAVTLLAAFGTLSPCGMLRETERKLDGLAAILPDAIVDIALIGKYGSLNPGKCVGLLLSGRSGPAPAQVAATLPRQVQASVAQPVSTPPNDFDVALQRANAIMGECRDRRLKGELKTHVQSTQCSNPRVAQAFADAKYRYMDLVQFLTTKRLEIARKIDQGQMTEEQALAESNYLMAKITGIERSRDIQRN
ncbi:MAG: hypothetical protein E7813_08320 [Bradyrhizobium sp.]|uniref:hypothetical protein n=1 Tax=Bradyrhizobium sp. TaxID=376 RepID=UPI0012142BAB|nr:hypothetical protein [Bradyrhizobium sp.]THD70421.1 MAG: hypothetical protein E7813_08320 [Bradyrhizobium sp.]